MYWPKEGSETYGHIQVKLLQEVVMATYTLRTFTAKNLKMKKKVGAERTVYQYHYTNWPDHGVPDHPLPVLSFVRKSASANPSGAGAIICHCSAGCGRSGTYIVIDAMLKQIRHRQSINVVDFLKHIRNQRNYLVQTEEQYVFIHDALVEAIESGETEIASSFIAKYIQLLQTGGQSSNTVKSHYSSYSLCNSSSAKSQLGSIQTGGLSVAAPAPIPLDRNNNNLELELGQARSQSAGSQWSLLERQYRLMASFKAKDFNVVSALKPANKNKNRTLNLIPLEAHRVHITPKPGIEGSDYINATFLMGFNHLREFIVTQHPVYETYSDFWQMVYDHNSQTVVLLSACSSVDPEFGQFWPQKEDEVDYGFFKVKLIGEQALSVKAGQGALIVTRDFIMRSNQDDYELQTKIIHCPGWPEQCGPLASVFDLIQVVQSTTQQQASRQRMHDGNTHSTTVTIGQEHEPQNGGPIIVVDKFGGTEAATFAVLTTLYKQINFEDAVDVYMYAKLAHLRRPGIWSSQDDYLFLYRAIENYASCISEAAAAQAAAQGALQAGSNSPSAPFSQTMTLDRHRHKQRNTNNGLRGSSTMRRPAKTTADTAGHSHRSAGVELGSNSSNDLLLTDQQAGQHNQRLLAAIKQPARVKQQQATLRPHSGQPGGISPYSSALSVGASPHQQLLVSPSQQQASEVARAQQLGQHLYPMGLN